MQERMWKVCRSFYCGNTSHNTYNIAHALSRSDRQQDIKAHMYLKKKKIAHMNIITLTLVSCTLNGTAQRERQEWEPAATEVWYIYLWELTSLFLFTFTNETRMTALHPSLLQRTHTDTHTRTPLSLPHFRPFVHSFRDTIGNAFTANAQEHENTQISTTQKPYLLPLNQKTLFNS